MTQALTFELLTVLEDYQDASEEVFVFPVSFAQKRLWFLDQFEPGSPFYNIPSAVRLSGELDVAILEQTLNEIVRRHEVLRTTFATMDEEPVQLIAPALELPLLVKDLRDLPKPEREAEALQLATEEAMRPFDLTRGPLLRVTLLQLEAREYIVLLTMHHIISDGWSMGVLIGEIAAIYGAFSSGRSAPLPELPIQYADFAHWQREWLQGEVLEAQISYWKQQLAGGASVLELPTDRPRPAVQTNRGATLSRKLPADLIGALKALGQRERVTQFMTLLAAFQTLLYRYSDQLDVSVGSPIANRNRAEIEGLIGFFVNTLVLRADFSGAPTFRELLQRVREVMLGAYAHQDLPFEMLVEVLQPERDMSRSPLFQVMFILQNAPVRAQRLPGLALEMLDVHSGSSTFDLTLSMAEEADGMDAAIEFNTDLFDASTIESMLEHFQVLLEGVVADPDQPVSRLPLLTADERRRLLVEWNDAVADYSQRQDLCVHQLFEAQVERTPDAVAVVFPATDETTRPERGEEKTSQHLTYRGLNQRANQLAHCLQKLGVGPETVVGVCVERSPEMIVSALGVLKAGGAYLPIDPLYPQERLAFMLQDSQVPVLLTQASLLAGLPAHNARTVCLDADWETIACEQGGASVENPVNSVTPENLVYMIYTSGSTGQSKGVMIQQRSLVNAYLAWEGAYQLRDVSTHLQMANFSFDVFSGDLVRALCSGGKLVVCPREWLLAPQRLYGLMRREGVACGEFVPAV
jgi:non-ribosomal peptide synthetase component F